MFAFLFSKIGAYVVGAVLIAALIGGGYWYVKHQQKKIADLQSEVANLKLGQEVLDKKQQKFDDFMAKSTQIKRRVSNERKEIDKDVGSVDDTGLQHLYDRYRLRPKGKVRPPAS